MRDMTSHTRTVVRECCKGDDQNQWRRANFHPPPALNPLTDNHQNLHRWLRLGYLPTCKMLLRSDKVFRFRACANSRTILYSAIFEGSNNHLQPSRHHGHRRKIRQKTWCRARMCLFWVAKPQFNIYTTLFPQNRHFGARFRRYLEIMGRKNSFNIRGAESKPPLNVIVAP